MFKNIFMLIGSSLIAQLIPFIILPIISNMYLPESFGTYSLIVSVSSILISASMGRYELALLQSKYKSEKNALVILCVTVLIAFFIFLILTIFVLFLIGFIEPVYLYILIIIFLFSVNILLDRFANSISYFKAMSQQRVVRSLAETTLMVFFGLYYESAIGLILGMIGGLLLSNFYLLLYVYKNSIRFSFRKRKIFFVAKKYVNFPRFNMPHAVVNSAISYLPILFIPIYYSKLELGLYAFIMRIIQLPMVFVGQALFNVLSPILTLKNNNKIIKVMLFQFLIAVFFLFFILTMKYWFLIFFSERYYPSIKFVYVMAPWVLAVFFITPYTIIPNIYHKQKQAFFLELFSSISKVTLIIIIADDFKLAETLSFYSLLSAFFILVSMFWYFKLYRKENV